MCIHYCTVQYFWPVVCLTDVLTFLRAVQNPSCEGRAVSLLLVRKKASSAVSRPSSVGSLKRGQRTRVRATGKGRLEELN